MSNRSQELLAAGMPAPRGAQVPLRSRLLGLALLALMALGSILMWVAIPILLLWAASQMQEGTAPSLGPYVMVLVGLVVSMATIGKLLAMADRAYIRATRSPTSGPPPRAAWLKSLRGERGSTHRDTVLGKVMVVSVLLALLGLFVWFALFAHYSMGP